MKLSLQTKFFKEPLKWIAGLLGLFAVSTLASQSLMDLFLSLLCLYLLLYHFRSQKTWRELLPAMGIEWVWLSWFIIAILGFALSSAPPQTPEFYALKRIIEYKWILLLYFIFSAFKQIHFQKAQLKWFSVPFFALCVYALVKYVYQIITDTNPEVNRLGGIFDFSMTYAHLYGQYTCAFIGLLFTGWTLFSKKEKWFYSIGIGIASATVIFTMTRGVWIGFFVAVVVMGFIRRPRYGFYALFGSLALAFALYFTVPAIQNRVEFSKHISKTYDTERVVLWKTNWMIFLDYPLFGVGYGQNKYLLREYYDRQGLPEDQYVGHAHNQYLHILSGTGALGLFCYLFVLGFFFLKTTTAYYRLRARQKVWSASLALSSVGAQVLFAVGGLTESNFEHAKVRFVIMLFWALGLWLYEQED